MGAVVITTSTAVDNRQAITDDAIGISNYGSGNKNSVTKKGDIYNLDGANNISFLDGGAINKAFDFAAYSLSEMLSTIIDGNKRQQETSEFTVAKIGEAIQASSAINAAASEATKTDMQKLVQNVLIFGGLGIAGYWLLIRGKK